MATINPPGYLHNLATHTAQTDRLADSALLVPDAVGSLRPRGGLRAPGDLAVTAGSGTSVNLSAGGAWVPQAQSNLGGAYNVNNDGTINLPIAAANGSLGRNDLVVVRVKDQFYTGSSNVASHEVITGTAASTPTDPTLPTDSSFLVVARVFVPAGAVSSASYVITPIAGVAPTIGGQLFVSTEATLQTVNQSTGATTVNLAGAYDGQMAHCGDTKANGFWDSVAARWLFFDTQWQTYTAPISVAAATPWTEVTYGNGSRYGQYFRKGREISAKFYWLFGTTSSYGGANSILRIGMPPGHVAKQAPQTTTGSNYLPSGAARTGGTQNNDGIAAIDVSTSYAAADRRIVILSASDALLSGGSTAWAVNAGGHFLIGQVTYETNFEA